VSFPTVTPTTDAERVLGQIQCGEIRCGAAVARAIAARHEAAYGGAFNGTPAQALLANLAWADALTALNFQDAA
jgi:hypothetical protein